MLTEEQRELLADYIEEQGLTPQGVEEELAKRAKLEWYSDRLVAPADARVRGGTPRCVAADDRKARGQ